MRRLDPKRLAVALLVGALGACAAPPAEGPETGTVRSAFYSDPRSLSLVGKSERNSEIIARLVTDSLVQYDAGLELRPRLAASWEVAPDGLSVTFDLRRGVRWHDGAPVTADDVVFTVEKVRDPATEATSYMAQFQHLVSVEAPDDHTVRATFSEPYADFLEAWNVPIIPRHLAGKDESILTGAFARHPVGCGPFRFLRHEPGETTVLEANPDYWDGRPSIDRIVFRIVPDDRTAYQALLRGELDIAAVTPDMWREARASGDISRFRSFVYHRLVVWFVAWNADGSNPFFDDPRVRRAMVLALDRERFLEKALEGLGRPAATTYHPDSPWADPEVAPLPHDPAEAARLLEEAGWTDGDGDGIRERDGRAFRFTLLTPAAGQQVVTERIAAWMQESLASVGVRAEIDKLEWMAFQERRRGHAFEATMSAMSFSPIPDQYELYHSTARTGGINYGGFADDEVDRLLERGRITFDPGERARIYGRLQERLLELQPVSCLFHFASPVLAHPRLAGVEPSPIDFWRITPGPRAWRWTGPRER